MVKMIGWHYNNVESANINDSSGSGESSWRAMPPKDSFIIWYLVMTSHNWSILNFSCSPSWIFKKFTSGRLWSLQNFSFADYFRWTAKESKEYQKRKSKNIILTNKLIMIRNVGQYLVVCVSVEVETSVNNVLERVILVTNWIHYPYLSSGQCWVHMI